MNDMKARLLSAAKKIETVEVEGQKCLLRRMNGAEADAFHAALNEERKKDSELCGLRIMPILLSLCLCDETGQRLFDNAAEVQGLDHILIERLAVEAMTLNGLTEASRDAIEKKLLKP